MLSVLSPKAAIITRFEDQLTYTAHSAYQANVPSLFPHSQQATCKWSQYLVILGIRTSRQPYWVLCVVTGHWALRTIK